ncbi:MAG TPA: hypothetical protein VHT30_11355 [Acidimicrobiales bacterium]|nr:hypothetical protein [Acidimicrobiales bacterium]
MGDPAENGGGMVTNRAFHAMGLELQIVELVERQTRARVQHRFDDAEQLEAELAELRAELAATSDFGLPTPPRTGVRAKRVRPAAARVA